MEFDLSGEPVHTRCLCVALTQGPGESIEFRADILDLRKSGLMELGGRIAMAGIIHKMEVRGAFSSQSRRIEEIAWDQSHVMHEPNAASKGECCRDPMARLEGLIGKELGEGFDAELKQCFGGPLGCTHVNTLLHELSSVVSRLFVARNRHPELAGSRPTGERIASRSVFFDAFFPHGSATTTLSVRIAELDFAPLDTEGNEVLFSHGEARLLAEVELAGWLLRGMQAKERFRRGPSCEDTAWRPRTEDLVDFSERSLGGGMTRFCLERFGDRDEDALLLSALLSLAPGMTQVGVALSDTLVPSSKARPANSPLMGPGPCYMLRAEGPLMERLFPRAAPESLEESD
jgi:hypothetical protein